MHRLPALVLFLTFAAPKSAAAQITLVDALRRADSAAVANRRATGLRDERDGLALAPLRGILPALRTEASLVRTTDPIGAFGTLLRQRRIGQADFDPSRLNFPAAVSNYGAGVIAEVPILNVDAWIGRSAAGRAATAGHLAADWTRATVRADVVRAYFGALLADEKVAMLAAATRSAAAHVRQAESLQRNGLATPSDGLLAAVKAGELDADLATAQGDVTNARRGLAVLVGGDGREPATPLGTLPTADALRRFVAADTVASAAPRGDVRAATLGADAARVDATRATAAVLPRLNGFARWDWNDPRRLFAGEKNWTVGLMASWSPFTGAAEIAEQRAATGRANTALALADGVAAQARLEVERTATDLSVALQRLAIAERGAVQATDAHRIVSRRYDGGLATVVELLDAAASDTHVATRVAVARFDVVSALAARQLAFGLDPAALAALDHSESRSTNFKDTDK